MTYPRKEKVDDYSVHPETKGERLEKLDTKDDGKRGQREKRCGVQRDQEV